MVLPIILVVFAIIALAIYYWYITIPIIIIIALLWHYGTKDSDKKEDYSQSRRNQSDSYQNSYQNYSHSGHSNYDSSSNGYSKKNTGDYSYRNSGGTKRSQAQIKLINQKLTKFEISHTEAQKIFGKRWESKLAKPDHIFRYVVETMQIRIEYSYNNYYTNKYGYLYSKVLEIIKIVMGENNYNGYNSELEISDESINNAFDTFGLTHESTKEQIKIKYRELSLKYHPDKNKTSDTTVKMTEINSAYEIIMGTIA